jgi:hypothetical protein
MTTNEQNTVQPCVGDVVLATRLDFSRDVGAWASLGNLVPSPEVFSHANGWPSSDLIGVFGREVTIQKVT